MFFLSIELLTFVQPMVLLVRLSESRLHAQSNGAFRLRLRN